MSATGARKCLSMAARETQIQPKSYNFSRFFAVIFAIE
jgi:hypothetical protein